MNVDELSLALRISHRSNVAMYVHGLQGVGKSKAVQIYCANNYHFYKYNGLIYTDDEFLKMNVDRCDAEGMYQYKMVDMRVAQMESSEVRGLPDKDDKRQKVIYYTPNQLPDGEWIGEDGKLYNEKPAGITSTKYKGILFLDEINRGEDDVLNALFQLVYDRKIEDYVLPSGWGILAAGNPSSSSFTVNSFVDDLAFKDRFCHVFITIDDQYKQSWINYMSGLNVDESVTDRITHFCMLDDGNLYHDEEREDIVAKPSPRSWEMVARLEQAIADSNFGIDRSTVNKVRMEMIRGLVGTIADVYDKYSLNITPSEIIDRGMIGEVVSRLEDLNRGQIQSLSWSVAGQAKKVKDPSDKMMYNVISFGKWMITREDSNRDLAVGYFNIILSSEQKEGTRRVSLSNPTIAKIIKNQNKSKKSWYNKIIEDDELKNLLKQGHKGELN
jgi:hypothetical protein